MGGGLLETNNQLERFTKNKKSKKLTYSMIGILLIIGSITLFKTYAFFEEKREFNVLKGRVPEFSHEDIQLAFTINGEKGEKFPTVNDGLVAQNVTCSNGARANWSNSLWALTNINSNGNKKVYCSVNFVTGKDFTRDVKIGDYISYTPEKTSYSISTSLTGYNTIQTINPSELNLWRVIRKNSDGSIDLVSEYLSSTQVSFKGKEGYKNYIGTLNILAKQYESSNITNGSRNPGYNGQTEYISDETMLNKTTAPWSQSTDPYNSSKGSEREAQGGGDVLYNSDINLVSAACNNSLRAYVINSSREWMYFVSSRYYTPTSNGWSYDVKAINNGEVISAVRVKLSYLYFYNSNYNESSISGALRPIVILKSGIQASSGDGTKGSPWKVN